LLAKGKHIKQPLSGAEQQAVGEALSHALGVMSGKQKSGSKYEICSQMFPDGAPADAAKDVSWQSCKSVLGGSSLLAKGKHIKQPLSGAEQQAVGEALSHALGVMSGKQKSGSKYEICSQMFPDGPPADAAKDASWQSCKSVLGRGGAFLAKRRSLVAVAHAKL